MKKRYQAVICILMAALFLTAPVSASDSGVRAAIRQEAGELTALGSFGGKRMLVNLVFAPKSITESDLTPETLNGRRDVILKTVASEADGSFLIKLLIPQAVQPGRCLLRLSTDGAALTKEAVIVDISEVKALLPKLTGAGAAATAQLLSEAGGRTGLADADCGAYLPQIASYVAAQYPGAGSEPELLVKQYMTGEGLARFRTGELSLAEFLERYEMYLGDLYLLYEGTDQQTRNALSEILKTAELADGLDRGFPELVFCAELTQAESSQDLQTRLLDRYAEMGETARLSRYRALPTDYARSKVFSALYGERQSLTSMAEVHRRFDAAVAAQAGNTGGGQSSQRPSGGHTGGGGGGGFVNAEPLQPSAEPQGTQTPNGVSFPDLEGHWARDYVLDLAGRQVVNGFEDGSFRPDAPVTRAEYVKMLTLVVGIQPQAGTAFADVGPDEWYAPYIYSAYQKGLAQGDGGRFMPDSGITREDAAVMLERAFPSALLEKGEAALFLDDSLISEYAQNAVYNLARRQILTGEDGYFRPRDGITRAEAAALLSRGGESGHEQ